MQHLDLKQPQGLINPYLSLKEDPLYTILRQLQFRVFQRRLQNIQRGAAVVLPCPISITDHPCLNHYHKNGAKLVCFLLSSVSLH